MEDFSAEINGKQRCPWADSHPLLMEYHDTEWGVPLHDESRHFEYLMLETMQAGLSWLTILKKREAFRKEFAGFDPEKIASFESSDIDRMMQNPGIIRYRKKLEAAVHNAGRFLQIRQDFGSFDRYLWSFTDGRPLQHRIESQNDVPVKNQLAEEVSADLKRRGFRFIGAVTVYAHLQAVGVINDHLTSCFRYPEVQAHSGADSDE